MPQAVDGARQQHGLADQLPRLLVAYPWCQLSWVSSPELAVEILCEVCTDSRPPSVVEAVTWALSQVCVCVRVCVCVCVRVCAGVCVRGAAWRMTCLKHAFWESL